MLSCSGERKTPRGLALTSESPDGGDVEASCKPNCASVSTGFLWLRQTDSTGLLELSSLLENSSAGDEHAQRARAVNPDLAAVSVSTTPLWAAVRGRLPESTVLDEQLGILPIPSH